VVIVSPNRAPALESAERISGLDGLRVLAVLTVLIDHQGLLAVGWAGVQFFFVLSGYLITGLLWRARDQPLRPYLVGFYGRRALRIFPLYYLVLGLFVLAAVVSHKGGATFWAPLPYLATYTFNLWTASRRFVESPHLGHFWSLCVEEQFYLLWPFFIFYCRTDLVRRALYAIVLAGPIVRLGEVFVLRHWSGANPLIDLAVYVLTPTYFDAFAAGALMALFPLGGRRKALLVCASVLVVVTALALSRRHGFRDSDGLGPAYLLIWGYSLVNVCAALTIDCLALRKLAPRFFDSAPMRHVGKISYGVYVLHMPVQSILEHALPTAGRVVRLFLQIPITIALAELSYRAWEGPFLARKDRWFSNRRPAPSALPS
jgi:peptidoglycan/LPS O-acetylase OafA/YrhL